MNTIMHKACLSLIICLSAPIIATTDLKKVRSITISDFNETRFLTFSTMDFPQAIKHTHASPTCNVLWTEGRGRNRMVILVDNGIQLITFRRTGPQGQVDKGIRYIQLANGEEFTVNNTSSCPLVHYLFSITQSWSNLSNNEE